MSKKNVVECSRCRFYVATGTIVGTCRRYPPVPVRVHGGHVPIGSDGLEARFPFVDDEWSCGEGVEHAPND